MGQLILQPTALAQWHVLVNEAEVNCSLELGEELESYLVFLLMRFIQRPELARSILAIEFLESLESKTLKRSDILKEVGDKCLLFSGLFPERAKRRRVQENYFSDLGQTAYYVVASLCEHQLAQFYHELSNRFLLMRDVLRAIKQKKTLFFEKLQVTASIEFIPNITRH